MTKELNPFDEQKQQTTLTAAGDREAAMVQAQVAVAQRFPRNADVSLNRILDACADQQLAEQATYLYTRGGQSVTGPSIRLAECLARSWGNIEFGVRELESGPRESMIEAFAWDLETNARNSKTFTVQHVRVSRRGRTALTDPRDQYENMANMAARRMRACILAIIPTDIADKAVSQCELTLEHSHGKPAEAIPAVIEAFAEYGVTPEQIAKRLGKSLDAAQGGDVVRLRQIYTAIRDGISKPGDWFPTDVPTSDGAQALDAAISGGADE